MRKKYLLDTNVLIHIRRKHPQVLLRLASVKKRDLALSPVTYGELRYGAEKSANPERAKQVLSSLVSQIEMPQLTHGVAEIYGEVRARLAGRGMLIGNNDLWIAAQALSSAYILVTDNEREFSRVDGLQIENWVREAP